MGQDFTKRGGSLDASHAPIDLMGARVIPGALDATAQAGLVADLRALLRAAPLRQPLLPSGRPMSVRLSAAGAFGWTSDREGYRYIPTQPSGDPWPPIPAAVLDLWRAVLPQARAPECCLINYYAPDARMSLHQDRDEADLTQPVLSISLGDEGLFRIGGVQRKGPTASIWLRSGDVVVLEGPSRLAFHGVDRIRAGSSTLLNRPGRINLTLRVVT